MFYPLLEDVAEMLSVMLQWGLTIKPNPSSSLHSTLQTLLRVSYIFHKMQLKENMNQNLSHFMFLKRLFFFSDITSAAYFSPSPSTSCLHSGTVYIIHILKSNKIIINKIKPCPAFPVFRILNSKIIFITNEKMTNTYAYDIFIHTHDRSNI